MRLQDKRQRRKAHVRLQLEIAAKLDHPGVVGVHDVIESDGILAYAMDWIPGGSLARLIGAWRVLDERDELATLAEDFGVPQGSTGPASVVTWLVRAFAELARALAAVHRAGLLHRDIKPGNLLVGRGGVLLLSDFGLVRDSEISQHTRTGAVLGTLAYSAPEQLRGEQERVDERSDLYSLGVSLHEALTLRLPFPATNAAERQRQAENGAIARPDRRGVRLPRDLETILAKLLEPDPARRYASGDELAQDLEALLALRPIRARPQGFVVHFAKAARRNRRTLLAALGGVSLALSLGVVIGWWFLRTPRAIDERQLEAELLLLESERIDRFSPLDWQDKFSGYRVTEPEPAWMEKLARALELYDEANSLDPLDLLGRGRRLERERDLVHLALAIMGEDPELEEWSVELEPRLPLTVRIARAWSPGSPPVPTEPELRAAPPEDREALGLLGYLLTDVRLAGIAWANRPPDAPRDVLADGALGVLHLYAGRFDLAYQRLARAFELAPRSDFLCAEVAFCAARLGEFEVAEELLARAPTLQTDNEYDLIERARADLLAARGQPQEALAIYRKMWHSGPRFMENFAGIAHMAGEFVLEAHLRAAEAHARPSVVRKQKEALDAAEQWWWSLGPSRRWDLLLRVLSGDRSGLPEATTMQGDTRLPEVLLEYLASYRTLPATRPGDEPSPRVWQQPGFGPQSQRVEPGFLRIAGDLVASGASEAELRALSDETRSLIATVWMSRLPQHFRIPLTRGLLEAAIVLAPK
ncbi:MAG: protein kinase [Planctomycetota bacterium]